jgi:hypothetical protein
MKVITTDDDDDDDKSDAEGDVHIKICPEGGVDQLLRNVGL